MKRKLILASKSPRRREILELLGLDFEVRVSGADERFDESLSLEENIMNTAKNKAEAVFRDSPECIVIGSDTIVVLDDRVLLKPRDRSDARRMIRALSGRTHRVITGICIMDEDTVLTDYTDTKVSVKKMSDEEIEEYIDTDEPYDKAGGYAVQGLFSRFVDRIDGDYFGIVGMSASKTWDMLKKFR